jgi:hypothetical protein
MGKSLPLENAVAAHAAAEAGGAGEVVLLARAGAGKPRDSLTELWLAARATRCVAATGVSSRPEGPAAALYQTELSYLVPTLEDKRHIAALSRDGRPKSGRGGRISQERLALVARLPSM